MGFVIQMQRRAIERLRRHTQPYSIPNLTNKIITTTTGTKLFVYGISRGIGTCADVHGMDVLVLGLQQRKTDALLITAATTCVYSVLIQPAHSRDYTRLRHPKDVTLVQVELLILETVSEQYLEFVQTGVVTQYVALC